jgi:hypothetical protein
MSFLKKLFKPKEKPVVYVVSGLPRSGTSMMMKMLDAGGIPPMIDEIRAADDDNPKGYYEYERVKQMDRGDTSWVAEAVGKAVKVISALLKNLPSGYQYRVIFMRRNMDEILASQRKMLVNRQEDSGKMDDVQMADLFRKHLAATEKWLQEQPDFEVIYVHYSDILADPAAQAERVSAFVGKPLNVQMMAAQVDQNLYRNRQKPAGL